MRAQVASHRVILIILFNDIVINPIRLLDHMIIVIRIITCRCHA